MTKQLIGIDSKLLPFKVLKETPGNPQQMDEKTFSGMVKSMKEKGWILDGPTIWEKGENDYQIISGHHRVQAGIEAGIVETQCKVIKGITEEQAKILVLEANQRRGEFDDSILTDFIDDIINNSDYDIDSIIEEVGFKQNISLDAFDFSDFDEQIEDSQEENEVHIGFVVPNKYKKEVLDIICKEGELRSAYGIGQGILKLCGLP